MAKWAYDKLIHDGLGIASDPIPVAQAPRRCTAAAGGPGCRTAPITSPSAWMNAAGEEGASAVPAALSRCRAAPARCSQAARLPNATGWNVYCGTAPDDDDDAKRAAARAGADLGATGRAVHERDGGRQRAGCRVLCCRCRGRYRGADDKQNRKRGDGQGDAADHGAERDECRPGSAHASGRRRSRAWSMLRRCARRTWRRDLAERSGRASIRR